MKNHGRFFRCWANVRKAPLEDSQVLAFAAMRTGSFLPCSITHSITIRDTQNARRVVPAFAKVQKLWVSASSCPPNNLLLLQKGWPLPLLAYQWAVEKPTGIVDGGRATWKLSVRASPSEERWFASTRDLTSARRWGTGCGMQNSRLTRNRHSVSA